MPEIWACEKQLLGLVEFSDPTQCWHRCLGRGKRENTKGLVSSLTVAQGPAGRTHSRSGTEDRRAF